MWKYLLIAFVVEIALSTSSGFSECIDGQVSEGSTLKQGKNAGDFTLLDHVENMTKCVEICCERYSACHVALFVEGRCYKVECVSAEACEPVPAQTSKYNPSVFTRNRGECI